MTFIWPVSAKSSSPSPDRECELPEYGVDAPANTSIISLSDSLLVPLYEHGRSYHRFRDGRYPFPNDEREQEREAMIHAVMAMVCQTLHFAPVVQNPRRILDIGTGTGLWAMEMGDRFPEAEIIGADLSPIQQEYVPPNVQFEIDDIESNWLHPYNHFDLIHSRHIGLGIRNWPGFLEQSYRHCKPGGWIEMHEIDYQPQSWDSSLEHQHPVAQYWGTIYSGLRRLGIHQRDVVAEDDIHSSPFNDPSPSSSPTAPTKPPCPRLIQLMEAAGFTNIHTRRLILPIGPWPKSAALKAIGSYWRLVLLDGAEALALAPLTRGLEWSRPRVELLSMQARRGYMNVERKMFMTMHVIVGQKPGG